jgi:CRISPR-associated protein Cas1
MAIVEDLVVSEYGAFVGLKGKRLRVKVPDNPPLDAPLMHLRGVHILTRSASISVAAISACCEMGIPIHFVDNFDGNYATLLSPNLTTVIETRRCQLAAYHNETGVQVAIQLGAGKIRSQAANLRYLARRQPEESAHFLRQTAIDLLGYADRIERMEAGCIDEVRAIFMGLEGQAARLYWEAVGGLLPESYGWPGRTGRHATDPINCLLNYGYGILYGEVQNALTIAGLEPYAGLLHTDRPGKPSLTLDLIEEFRAPVVDRTVIGLANRNYEVRFEADGRLEREFRKQYAGHILSRLGAQGVYAGKRYTLRSIIQMQARLLAAALRGERPYQAYTGG